MLQRHLTILLLIAILFPISSHSYNRPINKPNKDYIEARQNLRSVLIEYKGVANPRIFQKKIYRIIKAIQYSDPSYNNTEGLEKVKQITRVEVQFNMRRPEDEIIPPLTLPKAEQTVTYHATKQTPQKEQFKGPSFQDIARQERTNAITPAPTPKRKKQLWESTY